MAGASHEPEQERVQERVQEQFLRRFHQRNAGVTARALGRGRVAGGGSSYDALVRRATGGGDLPRGAVIDLGCGDGALLAVAAGEPRLAGAGALLAGVDLSRDELALAAARGLPASWLHARARALPLAGGSVALVLSHLAFTLMAAPDAVAAEIGRVLAPGGRFVTVVGGGPRGEDAYAGLLELARPTVRGIPRLGELRARSEAGLRALFAPWAAAVTVEDLAIDLSGSPDEVWATLATSYELDGLTAAALDELRGRFVAAAPRWRRPDGQIACTMATSLVVAIRR